MYERILVPLDGSKFAEQVFPPLVELARAFGSEVVLVEVCEPEETEFGQACRLYINNEAEKLEDNLKGSTAKVRTTVLEGKASEQILDYAEKSDVSLIMISSHGRSGLAPWSLGGTASKILHRVGVPLIIVRAKETPEESAKVRLFSRMLIPLDGSEKSEVILPYATELAKKLESDVTLLQVVETGRHVHTIGGLDYIPYKDWDINQMKTRVQRYLDGASSKFSGTKASVKPEIRVGESAREIIKLAAKKDSSLIAMSSHGRAGIEAWAHDSITGKILQASRQSFMFVPVAGNA
jgi:nucleotide-binding universal stress UspA family protein